MTKLEYFDRGFVDCIASNGVDKIKSSAFLEISQELHKWGEFFERRSSHINVQEMHLGGECFNSLDVAY